MTLPLDIWRDYMGFDPQHFWQLSGAKAPVTSECNGLVYERSWQGGQIAGRADIRRAILDAESKLHPMLGYRTTPEFVTVDMPYSGTSGIVRVPDGYVSALGSEVLTDIGSAAVALSDTDNDGVFDTFTAVLAPKAGVTLAAGDDLVLLQVVDAVAPVTYTIDTTANTATFKGAAWLLVKQIKYLGRKVLEVELGAHDVTVYVDTLSVMRRTFNTAQYGTFSGTQKALSKVEIVDARNGILRIAWSADDCPAQPPERIALTYRAGLPTLTPLWTRVLCRLAAAELALPICACQTANQALYEWQFDLSRAGGKMDEQFQVSQGNLDNPFGTRRGQAYAWREVLQHARGHGIAL